MARAVAVAGCSRTLSGLQAKEEAVFDVVDEKEYTRLVRQRRQEKSFVVDDGASSSPLRFRHFALPISCMPVAWPCCTDGLGYADDGEEFIDEQASRSKRRVTSSRRRGKGGLNSASLRAARRLNTGIGAQATKVDRMLTTRGGRSGESKKRKAVSTLAKEEDDGA